MATLEELLAEKQRRLSGAEEQAEPTGRLQVLLTEKERRQPDPIEPEQPREASLADTIRSFLPPGMRGDEPGPVGEAVGTTVRAGIEGVAAIPGIVIDPILNLMERGVRALGREPEQVTVGEAASLLADQLGLPPGEGLGFEVAKGMAGVSPGVAIGRGLATAAGPVTRRVGQVLAETPGIQTVAGATSVLASETAEALGVGPLGQLFAGVAAGGLTPAATVGAARTLARGGRTAKAVGEAFTEAGQQRIAGEFLRKQATDPSTARGEILKSLKDPPLTAQTTGTLSRDIGILTLERAMRAKDPTGRFAIQALAANKKRQDILNIIGGEDIGSLKEARDVAGAIQREAAIATRPKVDVGPVLNKIKAVLASPAGKRVNVRRAMEDFQTRIKGVKDAAELYEIRKDINDDIAGLSGAERSGMQRASSELIALKGSIDSQIEKVAPGFRKYLSDFSEASKIIDQQEIIQGITDRARVAIPDPKNLVDVLSQAQFRKAVIKEANKTGRNRKLTDEQLKVLETVASDLDLGMGFNVAGIRPTGSDTVKNLTTAHIVGRALGGQSESGIFEKLIKPLKFIGKMNEDDVQAALLDAILDPKKAATLLARPTNENVIKAAKLLREILGVSAAQATIQSQPEEQ